MFLPSTNVTQFLETSLNLQKHKLPFLMDTLVLKKVSYKKGMFV